MSHRATNWLLAAAYTFIAVVIALDMLVWRP